MATVKDGVVTAKKDGTATITAKVGSKKYTCKVTVLGYKINSNNVVMTKGKTYTLKVSGASKKDKIKFKSSKTSIASVNSKTGKITAKKNGTATITVTVGKTSFPVLVKVETPSLNKTKLTLKKGATYSLKVNSSRKVTWKSNNSAVAKVSSSGTVTAIKNGSAVITAKLNDKTFSCTVTVGGKNVIVCPSNITVGLGETAKFRITAGDSCTYGSANGFIDCDVSPSYFTPGDPLTLTVTGKKVGTDTITFTSNSGWTKVVNVNVTGTSMKASSAAPMLNNVKINSIKAYKGTGTNPAFNVVGSITNNNTLPLSYLYINYSFYDASGKYLDTFYATIKAPVKGKTYSFNNTIDSSDYYYPKGAASVIIASVDGALADSYKGALVTSNVPVTVIANDTNFTLSNFSVAQYYRSYNNYYDLKYSFNAKNLGEYGSAYVYFFFYDKDGKEILQDDYNRKFIYASTNESKTEAGTFYGIYGSIPYGDIASIKIVVSSESLE